METWAVRKELWNDFQNKLSLEPEAERIIKNRTGNDVFSRSEFMLIEADTELLGDIDYIKGTYPPLHQSAKAISQHIFCVAMEDTGISDEALKQEKSIWDL